MLSVCKKEDKTLKKNPQKDNCIKTCLVRILMGSPASI